MKHVKVLRDKKSNIRVSHQLQEEVREERKQLYDIQRKYADRNIERASKATNWYLPRVTQFTETN